MEATYILRQQHHHNNHYPRILKRLIYANTIPPHYS